MQPIVEKPPAKADHTDFLPLNGADFVEFYVGNAKPDSPVISRGIRHEPGGVSWTEQRAR